MEHLPRLTDLRVAVDVQHLYRVNRPRDRGAVFRLADGSKITEAHAATLYAQALTQRFRDHGASVLTNDPVRGVLVGYYSTRNRAAGLWGAHVYLACHLNAGGGSYALCEAMSATIGVGLAKHVATGLAEACPGIQFGRTATLHHGERGAVCIERVPASTAAVLLEPFFGDSLPHQYLFAAHQLVRIGETIARSVADWWLAVGRPNLPRPA